MIKVVEADKSWRQVFDSGSVNFIVESVFRSTLNLKDLSSGRLYSILSQTPESYPRSAIIESRLDMRRINHNDVVACHDRSISVGELHFSFLKTQAIDNQLQVGSHKKINSNSYRHLADWLVDGRTKQGSFYGAIASDKVNQSVCDQLSLFRTRLLQGDVGAINGLVGLGVGLTPSGDDYVVGLLSVRRDECMKSIVSKLLTKTTDVSRMYLEEALVGNFAGSIRDLVEGLYSGDETSIGLAADRVLGHGSTSGQDILTGMLDGILINQQEG